MRIKTILFNAVSIACFVILLFNKSASASDLSDKKNSAMGQTQQDIFGEIYNESRFLPGKLLFYCDLYEGYDNNVNLDSFRKKDMFSEVDVELGYKQPLTTEINGTLDYSLNSTNYHHVTDASFYDNSLSLNFDSDIFDERANIALNNKVEYNYYSKDELSTYTSYNPQLALKHNINESVFQKLCYDFELREYTGTRATDGTGSKRDTGRSDISNGVSYEIGATFLKDIFIKVKNEYLVNDSNDQFMDYYDYWAYRVAVTGVMPLLTKRLYGLVSIGYQRTDYNSRQLVQDNTKTEKDNLYLASSSVIFDITKRLSVSLNYTYRQNESNEPSQKYSGSIMSAGFHYAF